ncbi:twin transmembrane helix small protein [Microvirga tunisiensis]|uniref:Twin transmembrane helix small protein n=2 Tax=Pannonibacter tanglangensis TaxID=2750084 RepID=A0ABW9ZR78_9HYPH|nr:MULTISPECIES: twin transmembrane helix small protein [unclassified Pannonibacter]NBN65552.1 twin transmembrane helix small protein [Pannonibacter sp. XCT-34]NBN80221.1 twin transmembrane helix small protein [Pannonibacter sp. XCT-53]
MGNILYNLIPFALGAVALVLFLGLWNMFRGGSANRSQQLMRWRVGLQFLAIVLIMGTLYFLGPKP